MRIIQLVFVLGLMSACARVEASPPVLHVDMSNVDLRVAPDTVLHVHQLRGQFVRTARRIPYLDDKQSYAVVIESGEIALDAASLNALMTRTLGGDRSNIDKMKLTIENDGTLKQKGAIDKGIDIPFSAKSTVPVTPDGRIRVSTNSVKGVGVEVKDNDLILDPSKLVPSPAIRGRLTAVRVENGTLVQVYGSAVPPAPGSRALAPNHIYWRGGELSFGKLTMTDTDLELVDQDPDDPFDFSIDDWNAQLVAGYSKTMGNKGLRAFMPDYFVVPARQCCWSRRSISTSSASATAPR